MSAPIPPSKPRASLSIVIDAAKKALGEKPLPETFVLMDRAYYDWSMAKRGDDEGDVVCRSGKAVWTRAPKRI